MTDESDHEDENVIVMHSLPWHSQSEQTIITSFSQYLSLICQYIHCEMSFCHCVVVHVMLCGYLTQVSVSVM